MRFKKANFSQKCVKMLANPAGLPVLLPFITKNLHFFNSTTRFAVTKIKDFDGCRMGVVSQIRRERPMCRSARLWTTLHLSLAEIFLIYTLQRADRLLPFKREKRKERKFCKRQSARFRLSFA